MNCTTYPSSNIVAELDKVMGKLRLFAAVIAGVAAYISQYIHFLCSNRVFVHLSTFLGMEFSATGSSFVDSNWCANPESSIGFNKLAAPSRDDCKARVLFFIIGIILYNHVISIAGLSAGKFLRFGVSSLLQYCFTVGSVVLLFDLFKHISRQQQFIIAVLCAIVFLFLNTYFGFFKKWLFCLAVVLCYFFADRVNVYIICLVICAIIFAFSASVVLYFQHLFGQFKVNFKKVDLLKNLLIFTIFDALFVLRISSITVVLLIPFNKFYEATRDFFSGIVNDFQISEAHVFTIFSYAAIAISVLLPIAFIQVFLFAAFSHEALSSSAPRAHSADQPSSKLSSDKHGKSISTPADATAAAAAHPLKTEPRIQNQSLKLESYSLIKSFAWKLATSAESWFRRAPTVARLFRLKNLGFAAARDSLGICEPPSSWFSCFTEASMLLVAVNCVKVSLAASALGTPYTCMALCDVLFWIGILIRYRLHHPSKILSMSSHVPVIAVLIFALMAFNNACFSPEEIGSLHSSTSVFDLFSNCLSHSFESVTDVAWSAILHLAPFVRFARLIFSQFILIFQDNSRLSPAQVLIKEFETCYTIHFSAASGAPHPAARTNHSAARLDLIPSHGSACIFYHAIKDYPAVGAFALEINSSGFPATHLKPVQDLLGQPLSLCFKGSDPSSDKPHVFRATSLIFRRFHRFVVELSLPSTMFFDKRRMPWVRASVWKVVPYSEAALRAGHRSWQSPSCESHMCRPVR
jgi:ABC-type multidrug transport system fused ATPase/permease subunit